MDDSILTLAVLFVVLPIVALEVFLYGSLRYMYRRGLASVGRIFGFHVSVVPWFIRHAYLPRARRHAPALGGFYSFV